MNTFPFIRFLLLVIMTFAQPVQDFAQISQPYSLLAEAVPQGREPKKNITTKNKKSPQKRAFQIKSEQRFDWDNFGFIVLFFSSIVGLIGLFLGLLLPMLWLLLIGLVLVFAVYIVGSLIVIYETPVQWIGVLGLVFIAIFSAMVLLGFFFAIPALWIIGLVFLTLMVGFALFALYIAIQSFRQWSR